MEETFDLSDPKIYLSNGTVLQCYPLANTVNTPERKHDREKENTFGENVFLFLANAEKIFSDSRMFLADSGVYNGMAYCGGFKNGCLGAYLEWWIDNHLFSIDREGRPIWFLSGSPLSGCHACLTTDEEGKRHRADLQHSFMTTCKSYLGVCKKYHEAMAHCQAFTIPEVIEILKGNYSVEERSRLHAMMEHIKMDNEIQSLRCEVKSLREWNSSLSGRVRELLFEKHHEALTDYHKRYTDLLYIANQKSEQYRKRRIEMRKLLRAGELSNRDYQTALSLLRKEKDEAEWAWHRFSSDRLAEILGDDSGRLRPKDVDELMKQTTNP